MRLHGAMTIGCSAESPQSTIAVASTTSSDQIATALSMATRVLRVAKETHGIPKLVVFGSGLSLAKPGAARHVEALNRAMDEGLREAGELLVETIDVVVSASDLAMLRLMPSMKFGEVCKVPLDIDQATVAPLIDCLRRPPPITYESAGHLPIEWGEYVEDLESLKWTSDLWKQTMQDASKAPDTIPPNPSDVLSLFMYFKTVRIALQTNPTAVKTVKSVVTAVDGAVDSGLLDAFDNDVQASFLHFVKGYLVGDEFPFEVTPLGKRAAIRARIVIDRTMDHALHISKVLARSHLALTTPELLFVHSGSNGDVAKSLIHRLPTAATAKNRRFHATLRASTPDAWESTLNAELHEVVAALTSETSSANFDTIRKRIGCYVALSSPLLYTDFDLHDTPLATLVDGRFANIVCSHPLGSSMHLNRQLLIKREFMHVASTTLCIGLQPGVSTGCSFVTNCGKMVNKLATDDFKVAKFSEVDLQENQEIVEAIATALKAEGPLGSLIGTIGGVVYANGMDYRVVSWSRDERGDAFITFLPKLYIDLSFADYATGSRALDADELHSPRVVPFFVADTIVTLVNSNALPNTEGRAYRVSDTVTGIPATALQPLQGIEDHGVELDSAAGTSSIYVREALNDRLAGMKIGWEVRHILDGDRRQPLHVLNSLANSVFERVSY